MEDTIPQGIELIKFLNKKYRKPVNDLKIIKREIYPQIFSSLRKHNPTPNRMIENIPIPIDAKSFYEVHNPTVFASFILRKKEYDIRGVESSTQKVFHATPSRNVENILEKNFDYRRIRRFLCGVGIGFTLKTHYAVGCAQFNGSQISMIMTEMLMGERVSNIKNAKVISKISTDTGIVNHVFIKSRDDEYYPKYILVLH